MGSGKKRRNRNLAKLDGERESGMCNISRKE